MTDIKTIIETAVHNRASDIHISEKLPLMLRVNGALRELDAGLSQSQAASLITSLIPESLSATFSSGNDVDFAISESGRRLRVNVFRAQGGVCATLRLLSDDIPTLQELGLPSVLSSLMEKRRGLILVTGPTGSGKSTTLASMIDLVNSTRAEHIITIEDPIEYIYAKKRSVIHQREVGKDAVSFASALRSALREDPDIILIGEMRDYETIAAALTAAETGHLVLSTLHTVSAAQSVDRIIDACPVNAQQQVRTQLSGVLAGIITQSLIPDITAAGRFPATEVLIGTDAVLNLIREDKCHQIPSFLQSNAQAGMHTLNADLARLVNEKKISKELAISYSNDPKNLFDFLRG